MNAVQVLTSVTALVSVVLSATLAFVTTRTNIDLAKKKGISELALAILPRRLDALELTWSRLFDIESRGHISSSELDRVIQASIWLPEYVRDEVLAVFLTTSSEVDIQRARSLVLEASGISYVEAAYHNNKIGKVR